MNKVSDKKTFKNSAIQNTKLTLQAILNLSRNKIHFVIHNKFFHLKGWNFAKLFLLHIYPNIFKKKKNHNFLSNIEEIHHFSVHRGAHHINTTARMLLYCKYETLLLTFIVPLCLHVSNIYCLFCHSKAHCELILFCLCVLWTWNKA
jgi:hypothetical protein